jgi:zeaxanthin glucosyltransferase
MSSGRVLFVVFDEPGHVNPTFHLAKALRGRGYAVSYAALDPPTGSPSMADHIRAQGFGFRHFATLFDGAPAHDLRQYGKVTPRADARRWLDALRGWMGASLVAEDPPDVCIVDIVLTVLALPLRKAGIPTLMLSTSLSSRRHDGLPPLDSALQPGRSPLFALRTAAAWWRLAARRRVDALRVRRTNAINTYDLCAGAMRQLAPVAGIDFSAIAFDALFLPLWDWPTLVAAPAELEFPGAIPRGAIHLGASIDLERSEPAFAFDQLDASKRMVLCTFGSQTQLYPDLGDFIERLAAAAARLPGHQLVIAAGVHAQVVATRVRAPNAIVVPRLPQLALLARASLLLTHGGLSSVKESLWFDVPMIIDPRVNDQRGNAARVAHRGAGVVLPSRTAAPSKLAALIARVDADTALRARTAALGARIRASESGLEDGIRAITNLTTDAPARRAT